jgi:hypothetical protein
VALTVARSTADKSSNDLRAYGAASIYSLGAGHQRTVATDGAEVIVDEIIKRLIIDNKLTLTLLAMVFTPAGLYAAWRYLTRDAGAMSQPDVSQRLASVEMTLQSLVEQVARLSEQQQRLASVIEPNHLPLAPPTAPPRVITPRS